MIFIVSHYTNDMDWKKLKKINGVKSWKKDGYEYIQLPNGGPAFAIPKGFKLSKPPEKKEKKNTKPEVPKSVQKIFDEIDECKKLEDEAFQNVEKDKWYALNRKRLSLEYKVEEYLLAARVYELNEIICNNADFNHIEVTGFDMKNRGVNIKFLPGVTKKELDAVWEVIKELNLNNTTPRHEKKLNEEIVFWRSAMMTYKWIADKYFPNEIDREASIDKVKKIYKRNMGRDWRGKTPWGDKIIK